LQFIMVGSLFLCMLQIIWLGHKLGEFSATRTFRHTRVTKKKKGSHRSRIYKVETKAKLRYARITPRKVRRVTDLI